MLAKMVPSNSQSFTESCRNALARTGNILASVTAPLVLPFLDWWCAVLVVFALSHLFVFLNGKKNLKDIKEIDFTAKLSNSVSSSVTQC